MQQIETSQPASGQIAARRSEAVTRLERLRREHGEALLEGREFDHASLLEAEREIAGLEVAEGEAARREREQEEARLEGLRREMRRKRGKLAEQYLEAIERAESAAVELSDALKEARTRAAEISRANVMLGDPHPRNLAENEMERRLSVRLAGSLKPVTGQRRRFGQIGFPESAMFVGPWREGEEALVLPEITTREGEKHGDKG